MDYRKILKPQRIGNNTRLKLLDNSLTLCTHKRVSLLHPETSSSESNASELVLQEIWNGDQLKKNIA